MRNLISFLGLSAVLLFGISASCRKAEAPEGGIKVTPAAVPADAGIGSINVSSNTSWTLGADADWITFGRVGTAFTRTVSGEGSEGGISFRWEENGTPEVRVATVFLKYGNRQASVQITQMEGAAPPETPDGPLSGYRWMELPATSDGDGMQLYSRPMTVQGVETRNYSFYWDGKNLLARWVAYPLNTWLIDGKYDRSDRWALDPLFGSSQQPVVISRSYRDYDNPAVWSGYDRGHQIPNADRYNVSNGEKANREVFYCTNLTPQDHDLNSGLWNELEGKVRSWSSQFDTLYVVTGCTVEGSTLKVRDDENKAVTVPTGYFKALLGYAGATEAKKTTFHKLEDAGYYTAIAFYVENKAYADKYGYMACKMSIDELEELTGFDFFVNLPYAVGTSKAEGIESAIGLYW